MLASLLLHPWLTLAAALFLWYLWKKLGMSDFFRGSRYGMAALTDRLSKGPKGELDMGSAHALLQTRPAYREFLIPKRKGGQRSISAPEKDLLRLQRALLRRVFHGLKVHPAVFGFVRGRSIAHHAKLHRGRQVVVRVDIKDFFPSVKEKRLYEFFRQIGWDRAASKWLCRMTTHNGSLPQGAPTSPLLSSAVNYRMDKRLTRLCEKLKVTYSRYADDLTFSFDDGVKKEHLLGGVSKILTDEGYQVQKHKKPRLMRAHHRQLVTGLVVNRKVALPRELRRKLRAARHRLKTGKKEATWTKEQLQGWASLEAMIQTQGA